MYSTKLSPGLSVIVKKNMSKDVLTEIKYQIGKKKSYCNEETKLKS